jgi:fucose 4-O-acetylase-like acetyltransferase
METGAGRDRFVDLLRGGSIVAVVVGHWLVADLRWAVGGVTETSALAEVPAMWPATWLLVVIPLFFFVGGYANRRSWAGTLRRAEGYATFLDRRVHRVLVPSGAYVAVVACAGLVVDRVGGVGVRALGGVLFQPLWFLGAYLWVVALTPVTLRLHQRFGAWVLAGLGVLVALGDLGRFGLGLPALGYLNVLLVWVLMHQFGYFYSEGVLGARSARWMALGGLAATAALVRFGPYSATMVGVPGGEVGNMHPPTLAIAALGTAQIGLALLVRVPARRWLQRRRVWRAVIAVNLCVVSIYLWHQVALTVAARIVLPLGWPAPDPGTWSWWAAHLVWLLVPGAVLAAIVVLVGPAERVPAPRPIPPGRRTGSIGAVAVVLVGLGFLALAGSSATEPFAPGQSLGPVTASPALGVALLVVAWLLLRSQRTPRPTDAGRAGPDRAGRARSEPGAHAASGDRSAGRPEHQQHPVVGGGHD